MIQSDSSAYFAYFSWPPSVPSYFSPNDIVGRMLWYFDIFLLVGTRQALVFATFVLIIFVGRGFNYILLLLLLFLLYQHF